MAEAMTLREWLDRTPQTVPIMDRPGYDIQTADDVYERVRVDGCRAVVLEGPKFVGKTSLARRVSEVYTGWSRYTVFGAIKQRKDMPEDLDPHKPRGAVAPPSGLRFDQGHVFGLDALRQLSGSPRIIDRGLPTSMYFQNDVDPEMWEHWLRLLREWGMIAWLWVSEDEHRRRAAAAGFKYEEVQQQVFAGEAVMSRVPGNVRVERWQVVPWGRR